MLMISIKNERGGESVVLEDILTGELKIVIPMNSYLKALIEHIKDYETISIDGKVFDNPLTRDK